MSNGVELKFENNSDGALALRVFIPVTEDLLEFAKNLQLPYEAIRDPVLRERAAREVLVLLSNQMWRTPKGR